MEWKNTDPRWDIYKTRIIIILRPSSSGHGWEAAMGTAESKHAYYIHTDFTDHQYIDEWNSDWLWTYAPDASYIQEKIIENK